MWTDKTDVVCLCTKKDSSDALSASSQASPIASEGVSLLVPAYVIGARRLVAGGFHHGIMGISGDTAALKQKKSMITLGIS